MILFLLIRQKIREVLMLRGTLLIWFQLVSEFRKCIFDQISFGISCSILTLQLLSQIPGAYLGSVQAILHLSLEIYLEIGIICCQLDQIHDNLRPFNKLDFCLFE